MTTKTKLRPKRTAKNKDRTTRSATAETPAAAPTGSGGAGKENNKITSVVELLSRPEGATLPEIMNLTGWQPHSARAALTGVRKKGHTVERTKRDDATCYRIAVTPRL